MDTWAMIINRPIGQRLKREPNDASKFLWTHYSFANDFIDGDRPVLK